MSNSHNPIIPHILNPQEQALLDNLKSSALGSQGIESSPIVIGEAPVIVEPGATPVEKKNPLTLIPFEDGTIVKYVARGEGSAQQIVVTATGDQLCITRDEDCAALITDGVNVLFSALDQKQALENEQRAAQMSAKPGAAPVEDDMAVKLLGWVKTQDITSENVGAIRARLLLPFDCEWNALVCDLTASFEKGTSK